MVPQRSHVCVTKKEEEVFVPVADKAIQHKALRESLATYSASHNKQVLDRNLLKHKNPIKALDQGCLA
jgi:hypothetical protein